MSSDAVIRVDKLSKRYELYERPVDRFKQLLFGTRKQYFRELWALRDVSFEINKGEAVGIIGRNGAGKSTLLEILVGTLSPTAGETHVDGKIGALLELGSGFNLDFTGRENVYLNGALLGLTRKEIDKYFDGIVRFSGVDRFIDQTVRTYSNGMLMRLAFAIQTFTDPQVLIVDEVLAVGDIFFRQKCYKRLADLRKKGCSILLVSHSMNEVEQFCQRALLLHKGEIVFQGRAAEAVKRYYLVDQEERFSSAPGKEKDWDQGVLRGFQRSDNLYWPSANTLIDISNIEQISNGWARCTQVAICDRRGKPCACFTQGETASFFYEFRLEQDIEVPTGGVELVNEAGVIVHGKTTLEYGSQVPLFVRRGEQVRFQQDIALQLAPGDYTFNIGFGALYLHDYEHRSEYGHADLDAKLIRVCLLASVGQFAIRLRAHGEPVQLTHHGIADIPGRCRVSLRSEIAEKS
jgi:lipopolysaccharide transport system ATP-binding protein